MDGAGHEDFLLRGVGFGIGDECAQLIGHVPMPLGDRVPYRESRERSYGKSATHSSAGVPWVRHPSHPDDWSRFCCPVASNAA